MKSRAFLGFLCGGWLLLTTPSAAQNPPKDQEQVVAKGLGWLAKAQHKDGYWEGGAGNYPAAMTGLAGMALLAEGSTPFEGQFKDELNRAVSWLAEHRRKDGLLGLTHHSEDKRYMHSHGLALLFLANAYQRCAPEKQQAPPKDPELSIRQRLRKAFRQDLQQVLTDAVAFSVQAQNDFGGWYYVSAAEGGQGDELNQTALQLQALEAARAAGIAVPAAVLDRARKYLDASIPVMGRNTFDPKPRAKQPPAVAAALAAILTAGDLSSPLFKKCLPYCPKDASGLASIDLEPYFHCHYAQVMYRLGDKGYAQLFPKSPAPLTWSAYREALWAHATKLQNRDGSWSHELGPVFATANYLIALQVENGRFPAAKPEQAPKPPATPADAPKGAKDKAFMGRPLADVLAELKDPDARVRLNAVKTLSHVPTKEAVPGLTGALSDKDAEVAVPAARGLGFIGPDAAAAVPELIKRFQTTRDDDLRRATIVALGRIGPKSAEAVPLLIDHYLQRTLKTTPLETKRAIVTALGGMGASAKAGVPVLIKALSNPKIESDAVLSLMRMGEAARPAIPELSKRLQPKNDYWLDLAQFLADLEPKAARAALPDLRALAASEPVKDRGIVNFRDSQRRIAHAKRLLNQLESGEKN
jgi:hypothetical protein